MLTGRLYGGIAARSSPSTKMRPEVTDSSPASMRRSVDLPQPELPSSANSSFFAMLRLTLSTATLSPNFFTTFSMRTNSSGFDFVVGAGRAIWAAPAALFKVVEFMM
ncbi:hypothetical protein R69927_07839 [Paraburkholderia domus]|uniref:Uncharacterized protein n=1 Tax=Paraburkholderia domus TaxID=2793075 RepID=A0A9N8N395_9BURK|nr:hypothetical protein R70006_08309 [Paraburkholderia domus]CAE6908332.1 hypothetical protein R69749_08509 [Paraburkholderia domus]CAE6944302.1 hypothetical protein R69927_07839 [Paraburkholderia domus]CAE6945760.1 hypothetical protein R70211_05954 [Paraburkholderia domus]CAE6969252.1 hypothetical protein R75471_07342 [Paraburkholderia domus]